MYNRFLSIYRFLKLFPILVILLCCKGESRQNRTGKPNIVLILVDDMGFSDLGCYGGEIQTPNLDKFAENGIRFNQFYNTSKCFPSRACLLTGMYAQKCGMSVNPGTIENAVTIAEVLRETGYRTLMVGKHHGKENMFDRGFDRYFGLRDGMANYFNPGLQRAGEVMPARKAYDWAYTRKWCVDSVLFAPYTPVEKDFYTTDYFTNYAIGYLDEYEQEDKPFFLYMAFNAPHDPLMAWPEDIAKYIGSYKGGYAAIRKKRYEKQLAMGLLDGTFPLSEPTYEDWEMLSEEEMAVRDSIMATHAAMVDRVDQNIGRLVKRIEELGELENTLFLFMSDNGAQPNDDVNGWLLGKDRISDLSQPIGSMGRFTSLSLSWANVSNTPFRYYKDYSHNGGIATPLIISWPSKMKKKNRITNSRGHFIDILPTILEITGADYPEKYKGKTILPFDGKSLLPVILNEGQMSDSRPLYFQWGKDEALIKDNWKLVRFNKGPWELYDYTTDKTETSNIISENDQLAKDLISMYSIWFNNVRPKD